MGKRRHLSFGLSQRVIIVAHPNQFQYMKLGQIVGWQGSRLTAHLAFMVLDVRAVWIADVPIRVRPHPQVKPAPNDLVSNRLGARRRNARLAEHGFVRTLNESAIEAGKRFADLEHANQLASHLWRSRAGQCESYP